MRNRFDKQLDKLHNDMIEMGNLIEQAIEQAVNALIHLDAELAQKTIEFDSVIDAQEKEIEDICFKLLLQQQPVARDLRVISAALKMVTDMERIGDHAEDISEITVLLSEHPYAEELDFIRKMSKETTVMVVEAIEAFVNSDEERAKKVIKHDDIVDSLFLQAKKELIQEIKDNPTYGEQAADLLMVAKYFERIGDHATNIAEWVIYSITGVLAD
ncbi:MAG TPA: phosphate transport system regulatory protein PhoU [Lachnospiraceae bacterium]|nr:phosphate signaling complex protein PhoU [uncultured Lachnoclostridium sp.]HAU88528.1 phosphate transport system regulatory protein PhoU [Lachnospiraceae bacterium]